MEHSVSLLMAVGYRTGLSAHVTEHVSAALPAGTTLAIREVGRLDGLRWALERDFDLAIVVLNNMLLGTCDRRPDGTKGRVGLVLDAVRALSMVGIPVISMSGLSYWAEIGDLARAADARYYFPLPFKYKAFRDAVRHCLFSGVPAVEGVAGRIA